MGSLTPNAQETTNMTPIVEVAQQWPFLALLLVLATLYAAYKLRKLLRKLIRQVEQLIKMIERLLEQRNTRF
jgi:hypothetical protein